MRVFRVPAGAVNVIRSGRLFEPHFGRATFILLYADPSSRLVDVCLWQIVMRRLLGRAIFLHLFNQIGELNTIQFFAEFSTARHACHSMEITMEFNA